MAGEGFKLSMTAILSFVLLAIISMAMMSMGKTDVATLQQLFEGLGKLAGTFQIGAILAFWLATRGQTSAQPEEPKV
jgi:peptidoglycan/LPS O-acetylase OafA/YrhL